MEYCTKDCENTIQDGNKNAFSEMVFSAIDVTCFGQ